MTTTKTAYQCDSRGVLIGATVVQEDAFEPGMFLLPPNCTLVAPPAFDPSAQQAVCTNGEWTIQALPATTAQPASIAQPLPTAENKPEAGENQIAVIVDGQWQLLADYRGTTYWLPDGSKHQILVIGETPPENALPSAPPAPALTLSQAQSEQIVILRAAYQFAIQQPVEFTTEGGHTDTFAADTQSVNNLEAMLCAYAKSLQFPLNLWLNAAGVPVTPFTFADLQGLAQAIANQATPDYQELLAKIAAVMAATTVDAVSAVTW